MFSEVFDFCHCQGMGRKVEALYVNKMLVWYIISVLTDFAFQ